MAGHLALFHNYSKIRTNIIYELHRIDNLSQKEIQDALQTNRTINFGRPYDPINVYVIASLCGGTGSGCCVDMGYLIKQWNDNTRPVAFFTLPHPDIENKVLKNNAFTALIELNHFCLKNNTWSQQLPDNLNRVYANSKDYPYEVIYLTRPADHTPNEKIKNEQNIASFLISLTSGQDLAAGIVDGIGALQTSQEFGYLKPYFSTFGIASLEYPGEHISRMCKEKILHKLYGTWKDDSSAYISKDIEELFEKTPKQIIDEISVQSEIKSKYEEIMRNDLENLIPKNSAIHQIMENIFSDIEKEIRKDSDIKADEWIQKFKTNLENKFKGLLDKFLVSLEGGPGYISRILKKGKEEIDSWVSSQKNIDKELDKAKEELAVEKGNIEKATNNCLNAKEDIIGGIFKKKENAWKEIIDKCLPLIEKNVNLVVSEKLKVFIDSYTQISI